MSLQLSTALMLTGSLGLVSSLGGAWFGLVPIGAENTNVTKGPSGWNNESDGFFSVSDPYSQWGLSRGFIWPPVWDYQQKDVDASGNSEYSQITNLRVWAFVAFNLTEDGAGLYLNNSWTWYHGSGNPGYGSGTGNWWQTWQLQPDDYGTFGPNMGRLMLGAIALGAAMMYTGFDVDLPVRNFVADIRALF